MDRISLVAAEGASPEVQAVYQALQERFHKVPNLFATVAHHRSSLQPLLELFARRPAKGWHVWGNEV